MSLRSSRHRGGSRRAHSGTSRHRGEGGGSPLAAAIFFGAAAATAYGFVKRHERRTAHPPDSAPGRASLARRRFGRFAVTGRTVTVNRPRAELYDFWRNFANLPDFMESVEAVETLDDERTRWTISAPVGRSVTVETRIVEDRPGELIAWRSTPESQIETEGRVTFRDAPGNRGTEVEAIIAYKPPLGELGRLTAKLFQREPGIQARRELKRFKMLMETGEIADPRSHRQNA